MSIQLALLKGMLVVLVLMIQGVALALGSNRQQFYGRGVSVQEVQLLIKMHLIEIKMLSTLIKNAATAIAKVTVTVTVTMH